jgi:hypothetical protein
VFFRESVTSQISPTGSPCFQADGCRFQIPFTGKYSLFAGLTSTNCPMSGSGITIFVIQSYYPLNATVTVDGTTSTVASISNLPQLTDLVYNVTLYDVQSLPIGDHILDVALGDYTLINGNTVGSLIRFDAAAVNETAPSMVSPLYSGAVTGTPTAVSSVPTSTTSGGGSQPGRLVVYLIFQWDASDFGVSSVLPYAIGGAVGGAAVIIFIILALLCCRRRKTPKTKATVYPELTSTNFDAMPAPFERASLLYSSHMPYKREPFAYATSPTFPTAASNDWSKDSLQPSQSSAPEDPNPFVFPPATRVSTAPITAPYPFIVANYDAGTRLAEVHPQPTSKHFDATPVTFDPASLHSPRPSSPPPYATTATFPTAASNNFGMSALKPSIPPDSISSASTANHVLVASNAPGSATPHILVAYPEPGPWSPSNNLYNV